MRTSSNYESFHRPSRTARCIGNCRKLIAQTKAAILDQFRQMVRSHEHLLELALNEAEGLAWQTGYPQLVFPGLALEKANAVAAWHNRQESFSEPIRACQRRPEPPL